MGSVPIPRPLQHVGGNKVNQQDCQEEWESFQHEPRYVTPIISFFWRDME
jgi:hypothetical protein